MERKFVNIRMPVNLLSVIDQLAKESMRSRSGQIIYMLTRWHTGGHADTNERRQVERVEDGQD